MRQQLDWIWDRADEDDEEEEPNFLYPARIVLRDAYLEVRWPRKGGSYVDAAKLVQGYFDVVAKSSETDAKFHERLDLVNKSQPAGSLKVYIQNAFSKDYDEREEALTEAEKADQAVEPSENAAIKAMPTNKVTKQAVKQMKEKDETLRKR